MKNKIRIVGTKKSIEMSSSAYLVFILFNAFLLMFLGMYLLGLKMMLALSLSLLVYFCFKDSKIADS